VEEKFGGLGRGSAIERGVNEEASEEGPSSTT